ncbi:MAG: ABC transporter permease [Chloroflexota bacterium]|nr:ABC transporter permease [Chloroflexota bacterium]
MASAFVRLRVAFRKEFIQFFRSKVLIVLVLYVFAEIALCAYALTMDIRGLPLAVVDQDQSVASRALSERFRIAPYFVYRPWDGSMNPGQLIDRGQAQLVVIIPSGFARALDRGESAAIQVLADGTYSNFAQLALGYTNDIVAGYSDQIRSDFQLRAGQSGTWPHIVNQVRVWYMADLSYAHFSMVSMISISVLILGMLLPAAGIVREKESGTIEQVLVSPLRPWEFIVAKLVPMGTLMLVGLGIGLLEARGLFATPMRGNMALFYAMSVLLFFSSMGLGALIGASARNMQQTLLLTFALLFPMLFLSGTVVPVDSMPQAMQWLTYLSPLRFYLPIARGILFKDVGFGVAAANAAGLAVFGALMMTVGVSRLRHALAG